MSKNELIDSGTIEIKHIGSTAQLTLSNPKFHNALTWDMYKQLDELLDTLKEDDSVRVLVIRGSGEKAFAAGTDIKQFEEFTGDDGIEYEHTIGRIIEKLERFPKPTIAAVNGYAVGGGLIIAIACDLRYATEKAKFGAPMAKTLGNCLSMDSVKRLSREVGVMPTKELMYTGRLISADEANSIGFLTNILKEENFMDEVLETAEIIGKNAPTTVESTKIAFNRLLKNNDENFVVNFDDVIHEVYGSKDFAEGVAANLEKRPPVWSR